MFALTTIGRAGLAVFTFLDDSAWNSYSDLAGGVVLSHTATELTYKSDTGFTVTLVGTAFSYDAIGLPVGGKITGLDVYLDAAHLAQYRRLTADLTDYVTLALGQTSGAADVTPPDMTALYSLLRSHSDVINGSDYARNYDGFSGNDTFYGGDGDDWFNGGTGYDEISGGAGRDGVTFLNGARAEGVDIDYSLFHTITVNRDGNGASDVLYSIEMLECTNYDDTIDLPWIGISERPGFTIWLLGGNDIVHTGYGNSTIYGGAGSDTINGGDVLDGGDGLDILVSGNHLAFWSADTGGHGVVVDMTQASGQIVDDGFGNTETIGDDVSASFFGTRFADRFIGSANWAEFWGNAGKDSMTGGTGGEFLYGGGGADTISGGDGDDEISGGSGRDLLNGGAGHDNLGFWDVDATGHGVVVNLSRATGQVRDDGFGNTETARGFETLSGSSFNDAFTGGKSANFLWGNDGNDTLYGGGGRDSLVDGLGDDLLGGGKGDDFLWAFDGADTLTGGIGNDVFYLAADTPALGGIDTIADMTHLVDDIGIGQWWSAKLTGTALTSTQFIAGAGRVTASTTSQVLIYNTTTGRLYFDADGSGSASTAVWIASLSNHTTLTYQDFIVFT
jgi:Ca2+-binding RTX toxin-like protein